MRFDQIHAAAKRIAALCSSSALIICASSFSAFAQSDFPQKPIRVIGLGAGGATDILSRSLGQKLTEQLGKQIVIDHRPGAAGLLATELAVNAPADGYTLLLGNISTAVINPVLRAKLLKFDTNKALTGITFLAAIPNVIIAGPKFPPNTLKEALAYVHERPGQFNFSSNAGSSSHYDMVTLMKAAGIKLVHIPLKGAGETLPSLMRGEVHMTESNVASNLGAIRSGQIKAYAVTSDQRLRELPELPTLAESGFPEVGSSLWTGLFAPAATPKPVIDKLFNVTVSALRDPELKEFLETRSFVVEPSASPAAFNAYVQAEAKRWAKIIHDNPINME